MFCELLTIFQYRRSRTLGKVWVVDAIWKTIPFHIGLLGTLLE